MKKPNQEKLWTPSFLILWQGQFVSTIGDAVYSIALGFWVLAVTGSSALMGLLMAASTLPGVLVAPFAGVLIDRCNKKRLFILMDLLRGACIVLLATAAFKGMLAIWMAFAAGILLSICGAVFSPGIQSAIPDLVPKSKITNANSVFSIVTSGSNMIGNVAGGFLFQLLGAPLLFLLDGVSFLISGISLPFVKIPDSRQKQKLNFFEDISDGFRFIWKQKGLRLILIVASLSNFFSFVGIVLFMPLCQAIPSLGAGKYGVMMSCYMAGAMAGYLFLSVITVKPKSKLKMFVAADIICNISTVLAVNQPNFVVIVLLLLLAGFFNSIINVLLISTVQVSTPQNMRGKVMSFLTMTTQGLTPFAMALGGILGELLPIQMVISCAFLTGLIITIPCYFSQSFREYITFDFEKKEMPKQSQEESMGVEQQTV